MQYIICRTRNPLHSSFHQAKLSLPVSADLMIQQQHYKMLSIHFKEAGITCLDKPKVAITNIVCSYDRGFPLNLVRITMAFMDHEMVEYEPEAFPGLVCRIRDPKIVFLLFSSGKIIITGGKTMDDVKAGLDILKGKLSVMDNKFQRIEKLPSEV